MVLVILHCSSAFQKQVLFSQMHIRIKECAHLYLTSFSAADYGG